jgi:hypothetical protein
MSNYSLSRSSRAGAAALALILAMTAVSCTEDGPPPSSNQSKAVIPDGVAITRISPGAGASIDDPANGALPGNARPVKAQQIKPSWSKEEVVVPPKDAKWTIVCAIIGGPGHTSRAKQFKDQLAEKTNRNKWYVVHEEDKSTIYYGFYRTISRGSKEGEAAQADRVWISGLTNTAGDAPMQMCTFMQIDRPAPEAPAEWDMNTYTRKPKQYWSLQIAAYTADASDDQGHDRKWAAVESVKALRGQGIAAYFSHGETVSSVCVGIWPENAIKRQDKGAAETVNPNAPFLVSNAPFDNNIAKVSDENGNKLQTFSPKLEILDPTLYAMARQFPTHMINAEERMHEVFNPRTGRKEQLPEPSLLVLLPEQKTAETPGAGHAPIDTGPLQNLPPALLQTGPSQQQPGTGKLKEIGQ